MYESRIAVFQLKSASHKNYKLGDQPDLIKEEKVSFKSIDHPF